MQISFISFELMPSSSRRPKYINWLIELEFDSFTTLWSDVDIFEEVIKYRFQDGYILDYRLIVKFHFKFGAAIIWWISFEIRLTALFTTTHCHSMCHRWAIESLYFQITSVCRHRFLRVEFKWSEFLDEFLLYSLLRISFYALDAISPFSRF